MIEELLKLIPSGERYEGELTTPKGVYRVKIADFNGELIVNVLGKIVTTEYSKKEDEVNKTQQIIAEFEAYIQQLESELNTHVKNWNFEEASCKRDEIIKIRKQLDIIKSNK